jgi:hypothetical protein
MKKALLVGINRYQTPGNDLRGCINDVTAMRDLLITGFGYQPSNVQVITDEKATKSAIVAGLKSLLSTKADQMVFHYSGHGTQFFDSVRNENDDAICPSDARDMATLLTDHEISKILSGTPDGCRLAFVADCCHSGTLDRNFVLDGSVNKPKMMHLASVARPNLALPPKKTLAALAGCHLLLSGCKDEQTSADAEFESKPHGALTYSIMQVLKPNYKQTWKQLHLASQAWLAKNNFVQIPQLSGPDSLVNSLVFQ